MNFEFPGRNERAITRVGGIGSQQRTTQNRKGDCKRSKNMVDGGDSSPRPPDLQIGLGCNITRHGMPRLLLTVRLAVQVLKKNAHGSENAAIREN